MSYRIAVDWAPAYELVASLDAYTRTQARRLQDQGDRWVEAVREQLSPALRKALDELAEPPCVRTLGLLIRQCPGERTPEAFLDWLACLSPGDLYELLAPHSPEGGPPLARDLGAQRDQLQALLTAWHSDYFRHVDPALLHHLQATAATLEQQAATARPEELAEAVTGGYWIEPEPGLVEVLLVPQHHKRPLMLWYPGRDSATFLCPVDAPAAPGEPSAPLLRLTRALADESRLRILHFLAGGSYTFTEVVEQSGLTKGTVHKHLFALRSAGLLRAHFQGGAVQSYSLSPGAFARTAEALNHFVQTR